ncbi:virulence factor TspB C-terminal domain-related protein [Moraxella bovis]|uniref:virulence factor TspB C-terminal domain-related protein n=1 Tax=Moraxella bovis TaxID=476 RepID=UPI0009CB42EB|nr:virulence factor TspB C-terminal domain-related protein [Moraxella bovis]OOR88186.1 hypothetical protein B0182_10425 [Moraxella bovis]
MNYNRSIITLLAMLSLCASTLAYGFQESPYPGDVTPTPPKKPNPMIDPPAPPGERLPPIDIPPTKPPSKWDKVKKNIGKLKPSPADIAIGIGIYGIGELVDFVMDPDNNRPKRKISCEVGFGDDKLSLTQYAALSRQRKDAYGDYTITANSDTYKRLAQIEKQTLQLYEGGSYSRPKDWSNSSNTTAPWDVTRIVNGEPRVHKSDYHVGVHVRCFVPDLDTKPSPSPETQPQPKPVPSPSPSPETQPQPKPVPVPSPNPNPETQPQPKPVPSPSPSPSPSPETQPQPKPVPSPNPSNNPSPTMPPDVAPIGREPENKDAKPFELPAFCGWAKPVCDWIEWTKQDAKKDTDTQIDIDEDKTIDFRPLAEKSYITLPKTCPPNPRISFNMPFVAGAQTLEFPLDKFCEAFALFKIVVILFAYIKALSIVGQGL